MPAPLPDAAPLLRAELPRLREAARLGPLLDLACGSGRHALALAREGLSTLGLDRDATRLAELRAAARAEGLRVSLLRADLERGDAIPLASGRCGAVLVFRYLHRPLAPEIVRVLAPGGLLLYETFTEAHRDVAEHPRNPAFLLGPGELPRLFAALTPLRAEEARVSAPAPEAVARLVAEKLR